MRLTRTVPALPVREMTAAVRCYTERFGFAVRHQEDGFAIVVRDEAELHLWLAGDAGWPLRPAAELAANPVCTGAETFLAGTASCRVAVDDVDGLYAELAATEVLHPTSAQGPADTDYGTREFATLDLDGNLLTFFRS
ncbi:MAG TPA: VOC family protein [Mycobacteriales bacterium]|jgi:catechol 2,3-dioxygenase-like lactoylglutathione lyase family enzyme|nr:VOC family protein [Mycobacteriales bacterium]